MRNINERIKQIRDVFCEGSNDLFAETLGKSKQTTSNYVRDGYSVGQTVRDEILSKFPDVNNIWLLTGEGSMLKSDKIKSNVTPVEEGNYMMVEYADLRASAGKLGVGDVELLPDTHKRLVPKEFNNGNFLIVRVDGDSMDDNSRNSLCDGDEVLICERQDYKINELPIRNSLFVITTQDGNVLKQIAEINMDEEYIVCRSFNPSAMYSDFKIYFRDIFQIFIVCKVTNRQIRF